MRLTAMLSTKTVKRGVLTLVAAAGLLGSLGAGVARADSPGVPNLNYIAVSTTTATVVWTNTADEGHDLVRFQLAYRVGSSAPPTYVGGAPDPYNTLTDSVDPLPDDIDYNQQGTYEVTGLAPSTEYCFNMRSYVYYGDPADAFTGDEPTPTYSDWSAEMCATTTYAGPTLQNVKVTATTYQHSYAFDIAPGDGSAAQHYTGTYGVTSNIAHEDYGKASWDFTCPSDPWTYPTSLVCTQPASLAGSSLYEPAGALAVSKIDGGYAVLEAALQKALAALPLENVALTTQLTSASATLPKPGKINPATQLTSASATLPKPDLNALKIDGPTTIHTGDTDLYTAAIRNNGSAANGDLELQISFTGGLQAWDSVVQSIGLNCFQGPLQANFTCQGGTLAAGQQATLQFRAHATSAGQNTITVALNPTRIIDESDLSNNNISYTVTVTK